jgi:GntR family transcriptional regulator, transcriptional repressor for pyruvate dehydrogenase complex
LTLEELWAAREAIEIPAAGMAALRRTEQDLATMRKHFGAYFPDITFHTTIASASKNRLISLFMVSIGMTIRTLSERYTMPEGKQISQEQHRLIYEAILEQDEALAKARMKEHLQMAYQVYRQAVTRKAVDWMSEEPTSDSLRDASLSGTS